MENDTQNNQKDDQKNWLLPASILTAAVIIAVSVIYSTGLKNYDGQKTNLEESAKDTKSNQEIQKVSISSSDVVLGNPDAAVTIIEFGDYQCPFCAKFFKEVQGKITDNYVKTGKAKMIYKELAFLGSESEAAALAAGCAREQGKFWQFHDAIFETEWNEVEKVMTGILKTNENNGNLNRKFFEKTAIDLKMDTSIFLQCFDAQKYKNEITENYNQASKLMNGKISTPTLFINGQMIQGSYNDIAQLIDTFLKK
ncbi:MAG: DsbA family protein [Patescibacteria group bacterium]|nr:DsbA family protein [Patescibacteria group bacterium]